MGMGSHILHFSVAPCPIFLWWCHQARLHPLATPLPPSNSRKSSYLLLPVAVSFMSSQNQICFVCNSLLRVLLWFSMFLLPWGSHPLQGLLVILFPGFLNVSESEHHATHPCWQWMGAWLAIILRRSYTDSSTSLSHLSSSYSSGKDKTMTTGDKTRCSH